MEIEGKVHLHRTSAGSKSEHKGVFLETADGRFVLLHHGSDPFNSPLLKSLVGQQVKVKGEMGNSAFQVQEIKKI